MSSQSNVTDFEINRNAMDWQPAHLQTEWTENINAIGERGRQRFGAFEEICQVMQASPNLHWLILGQICCSKPGEFELLSCIPKLPVCEYNAPQPQCRIHTTCITSQNLSFYVLLLHLGDSLECLKFSCISERTHCGDLHVSGFHVFGLQV